MPSVLIVDDEPNIRRMVGALLAGRATSARRAGRRARHRARRRDEPDVAAARLMMPGDWMDMATLARLRESLPDVPV
jgi:two-component system nitrogen regulation response regulator NtrX